MKCELCESTIDDTRSFGTRMKGLCVPCSDSVTDERFGARGKKKRKSDRYYMPYEWREELRAKQEVEA
jgi:hypothetical protein